MKPIPYFIFSYEDENKEVPEEDKDKVVIYTTSLGVNRELVANCNRAIQIIRSYKVTKIIILRIVDYRLRYDMRNAIYSILSNIKKVFGNDLVSIVTRNFLQCHGFTLMEFILAE